MSMAEKVRLDNAIKRIEALEARVAEIENGKEIEGEMLSDARRRRGRPPKVAA